MTDKLSHPSCERDLEAVCRAAEGFELSERVEMPANNQTLVFRLV